MLDNARQHAQAYHIGLYLIAGKAHLLRAPGVIDDVEFCDNEYE